MPQLTCVMRGGGIGAQVQQQHPTHQTSGIPPLVQSAVLTDRRHLLTKDAQGNVELWDITTGAVAERFGKVDFGQKEAELFAPESVPPWFTWDTKLGSLTLHFETPQVFAAEVYAHSMGLEVPHLPTHNSKGSHSLTCYFAVATWLSTGHIASRKPIWVYVCRHWLCGVE